MSDIDTVRISRTEGYMSEGDSPWGDGERSLLLHYCHHQVQAHKLPTIVHHKHVTNPEIRSTGSSLSQSQAQVAEMPFGRNSKVFFMMAQVHNILAIFVLGCCPIRKVQGRRSRSGRGGHGRPTFGPIFFFFNQLVNKLLCWVKQ